MGPTISSSREGQGVSALFEPIVRELGPPGPCPPVKGKLQITPPKDAFD